MSNGGGGGRGEGGLKGDRVKRCKLPPSGSEDLPQSKPMLFVL